MNDPIVDTETDDMTAKKRAASELNDERSDCGY